jgi:hypothetical protein
MKNITHFYLVPILRIRGVLPSCPIYVVMITVLSIRYDCLRIYNFSYIDTNEQNNGGLGEILGKKLRECMVNFVRYQKDKMRAQFINHSPIN